VDNIEGFDMKWDICENEKQRNAFFKYSDKIELSNCEWK
jgi:hypothetical protein